MTVKPLKLDTSVSGRNSTSGNLNYIYAIENGLHVLKMDAQAVDDVITAAGADVTLESMIRTLTGDDSALTTDFDKFVVTGDDVTVAYNLTHTLADGAYPGQRFVFHSEVTITTGNVVVTIDTEGGSLQDGSDAVTLDGNTDVCDYSWNGSAWLPNVPPVTHS